MLISEKGLRAPKKICDRARRGVTVFRSIVFWSMILFCFAGCRQAPPPKSDRGEARTILEKALSAWSAGESAAKMRAADPPIYTAEELWESGRELVEYSILDEGQFVGSNVCFQVSLKVKSENGQTQTKTMKYLVTSTPAQTIARLDQ